MPDSLTDRWHHFRAARPVFDFLHLNTAAAGRQSRGTLRASAAHLEREAATDAYMAEAEARPVLMAGRAALAGLLGVEPEGIAFTESATAALSMLLRAWPLPQAPPSPCRRATGAQPWTPSPTRACGSPCSRSTAMA